MDDLNRKREEIKWVIARETAEQQGYEWANLDKYQRSAFLNNAQVLIGLISKQGCVLKVDRELDRIGEVTSAYGMGYEKAEEDMLEAGYVAVEPLIEEK